MRISDALPALLSVCASFIGGCSGSHSVVAPRAAAGADPGAGAFSSDAGSVMDVPAAEPSQSSSTLCGQLASLQCGAEQQCCSRTGRDLDTCQRVVSDECAQSLYLDDIAANARSGFDMQWASAVFLEFAQRLGRCDPDVARWGVGPDGFRSIFRGTIDAGASCKPAQLLTADTATQAAAIVSCRDPETTACLPQSLLGEWICAPKGTSGASCLTDDNCQQDAYCSNPEQAPLGACQMREPEGSACTDSAQCESLYCVDGACRSADVDLAYCPTAG